MARASDEDLARLYAGESAEAVAEGWLASGAGARPDHVRLLGRLGRRPRCAFTAGLLAHLHHADRLDREGVDGLRAGEFARLLSYVVKIAADPCTRAGSQSPYRRDDEPTRRRVRAVPRSLVIPESIPSAGDSLRSHSSALGASMRAQTGPRASNASRDSAYASSSTAARSGRGS